MPPVPKPEKKPKKPKSGFIRQSPKARERKKAENLILAAGIESAKRRDWRKLNGLCIACVFRVPLPNGLVPHGQGTEYNHCIPRSRLPGPSNWPALHSERNLAPACPAHHHAYDRMPEFWLPLLREVYGYNYDDAPFNRYTDVHPAVAQAIKETK